MESRQRKTLMRKFDAWGPWERFGGEGRGRGGENNVELNKNKMKKRKKKTFPDRKHGTPFQGHK